MRRFIKIFLRSLGLVTAGLLLLVSWAIYSIRPIYTEDRSPARQVISPESAKPQASLKLLTWNIEMLPSMLGAWITVLDRMQHQRAAWITEYLKEQDYDLVCFQEAFDPKCVKQIVDGLAQTYPYVVLPRYEGRFWQQGNGVLFLSRVPIKYIADTVFPPGVRVERFAAKGCTLIEGVKDGLIFQIAGTHFQTGGDHYQSIDSHTAAENILRKFRRPRVPQFFIGDFNIYKDSKVYARLLQEADMIDFPVDDPNPFTRDSGNYWNHGRETHVHIDHILLNPAETGTAFVVQHIQRATREYNGETIDLSDHYGVFAEFLLKN